MTGECALLGARTARSARWRQGSGPLALAAVLSVGSSGCSNKVETPAAPTPSGSASSIPTADGNVHGPVDVGGGRMIYLRCTGTGSPTVILEGGDEDTGGSYDFAVPSLAKVTRTCSYDRANLGLSDPAPGPRGLPELVADLEHVISAAHIPGPYVLVGTSGGGYITAGYAFAHPDQVKGMLFVDVGAPFRDPPAQLVRDTAWDSPVNIEKRDYLQVEKDAWSARERVGDIPVTVISNEYTDQQIAEAEFPSERRGMRTNVKDQKDWLILSPQPSRWWSTPATPSRRPTPPWSPTRSWTSSKRPARRPARADALAPQPAIEWTAGPVLSFLHPGDTTS